MRSDIAKLIVERPRSGGPGELDSTYRAEVHWATLRQEGREEDSPSREHIRRKWGWDRKTFNDYLAPIRGFLRKSVGRPWDDVWSEISKHLKLGSTTQRHVLGHVFDYVEIHTIKQADGSITDSKGQPIRSWRYDNFYVDPDTGLLCEVERKPSKNRWRWRPTFPVVRFHRIDGIWYEVGYSRAPVIGVGWAVSGHVFSTREKLEEWLAVNYDFYRGYVREVKRYGYASDVVVRDRMADFSRQYGRENSHWLDGGTIYCSSKRQAGKKELRKFGLRTLTKDHGGPKVVVPAS